MWKYILATLVLTAFSQIDTLKQAIIDEGFSNGINDKLLHCMNYSTSCSGCIYQGWDSFWGECSWVPKAQVKLSVTRNISGTPSDATLFEGEVTNFCYASSLALFKLEKGFFPTVLAEQLVSGNDTTKNSSYALEVKIEDTISGLNEGEAFLCLETLTRDIIFYCAVGFIVFIIVFLIIFDICCIIICICVKCGKKKNKNSGEGDNDSDESVDIDMEENNVDTPSTKLDEDDSGSAKVKIVVIGDGAVGKTCMLVVYGSEDHAFPKTYIPTIFDNYHVSVDVNIEGQNKELDLSLWDTAGQEDYDDIRKLSYTGVDVFIATFSVVNQTSFSNLKHKWINEVKQSSPNASIILVGTKSDLRGKGREEVSVKNAEKFAKKIGAVTYLECSAMKYEGIKEIFDECVNDYVYKHTK